MSNDFIDMEEFAGESGGAWDFGPPVQKAAEGSIGSGPGHSAGMNAFSQYDGGNGVVMPGPMSGNGASPTFESGFDPVGSDMNGLAASSPTVIVGVQMPGSAAWEPGFGFGEDSRNLAGRQQEPPDNQNFGVPSDDGDLGMGDMEPGASMVGRMVHSNVDVPMASDILPAFDRLVPGGGGHSVSGAVPGMDSLRGIPLGEGSGKVGGDGDNSASSGMQNFGVAKSVAEAPKSPTQRTQAKVKVDPLA